MMADRRFRAERFKIAGIPGEHDFRDLLLCPLGHADRFPDVGKMIGHQVP